MTIKHWPASDRPREKLLEFGAEALSDAELLAIFLRTGCQGHSAVDIARLLLSQFGSLRALVGASRTQFCAQKGLGSAKYVQLQAVMEMAKRHLAEPLQRDHCFTDVAAVKRYLHCTLRDLPHEKLIALFLDTQHRLMHTHTLATGTLDGATVYPREVLKAVLAHNAAAVILAHNHPSGVAEPSIADRDITERLCKALALIEVRVLDHLVVGDREVTSFAERGWLP